MTNLKIQSPEEYLSEAQFQRELPGEAFTRKRKSLPFSRPPVAPDPSDALEKLFNRLMQPKHARQVLGLMDAGVPVDLIAGNLLTTSVMEGFTTPQSAILMTPSVLTMLVRMGQEANIDPVFSEDKSNLVSKEELAISKLKASQSSKVGNMTKAVGQSSDLINLPKSESGLLDKPEELA